MNIFDVAMLSLVGIRLLIGLIKGIVRSGIDLFILVGSAGAACWYFRSGAGILSAGMMFSVCLLGLRLMSWILRRSCFREHPPPAWRARLAGGVLGIFEGILYVCLVVYGLHVVSAVTSGIPFITALHLSDSAIYTAWTGGRPAPAVSAEPAAPGTVSEPPELNPAFVQAVLAQPSIHELLADEEFKKLISEQNIGRIMAHPKFQALLNDPSLVPALLQAVPARATAAGQSRE